MPFDFAVIGLPRFPLHANTLQDPCQATRRNKLDFWYAMQTRTSCRFERLQVETLNVDPQRIE